MLNIDDLRKRYLFIEKRKEENSYFCNCGHYFTKPIDNDKTTADETMLEYLYPEEEGLEDIYKHISLNSSEGAICEKCGKSFSTIDSRKKSFVIGENFIADFDFSKNEKDILLHYNVYKVINNNGELLLDNSNKYLRYNIENNLLFYKLPDETEKEFDLHEIKEIIDKFFDVNVEIIQHIINLHIFIGDIANQIIDIKNINLVDGLLNEIKGVTNIDSFIVIKKIFTILFGILKYTNLSTIAMTKGSAFLYDLMTECKIPNSQTMKENNVTSPIKIFNFLIKRYIHKINDEINEDNVEKHEFIYKSKKVIETDGSGEVIIKELDSEKEKKFNLKSINNYTTKVQKNNANDYEVFGISEDATASKFIFKKIRNFSDYKQILKYFKFYNKQEIISLLQKYEIDFLTNVIDIIYFRDVMDMRELRQIFSILQDYIEKESAKFNLDNKKILYHLVKNYDFTYYDDSIMMMEVLDFDPKREFNKIKTQQHLMEYHNNLVKYFNVVSDKKKNEKFREFVNRFRFIEDRSDYDGPLRIKLIDSPSMLIQEGIEMKHSASSYSKKVINNIYLIGQVFDETPDLSPQELTRFTIGFNFSKINGLEFHQVKGNSNQQGSDEFKKRLMEFLKIKDISFKPLRDLKLSNAE